MADLGKRKAGAAGGGADEGEESSPAKKQRMEQQQAGAAGGPTNGGPAAAGKPAISLDVLEKAKKALQLQKALQEKLKALPSVGRGGSG